MSDVELLLKNFSFVQVIRDSKVILDGAVHKVWINHDRLGLPRRFGLVIKKDLCDDDRQTSLYHTFLASIRGDESLHSNPAIRHGHVQIGQTTLRFYGWRRTLEQ